jgi:hypothetical protein
LFVEIALQISASLPEVVLSRLPSRNYENQSMPQRTSARKSKQAVCSMRFEAVRLDSLFEVLDALAWLNLPNVSEISQFAGIDPRTSGKLLKNSLTIGLIESVANERYSLLAAYPHKGSVEQKRAVVREALVRMPLLKNVRQFLKLGESLWPAPGSVDTRLS